MKEQERRQRPRQKQIRFGNDNQKGKCNGKRNSKGKAV